MYRTDRTRAPPMLMSAYKRVESKKILDNTPADQGNVFYPWLIVKENTVSYHCIHESLFFHPFKESQKKYVPQWKNQQGVIRVRKEDIPLAVKFALDHMRDEKNIVMSGFTSSAPLYNKEKEKIETSYRFDQQKMTNFHSTL